MKLKEQMGRLVAIETLFLTLCPLILIPQASKDQKVISETLEELEELKECYSNLGLKDMVASSNKKAKKEVPDQKQEALGVLIDFLTSLLTKPQSYLRDVVNNCFKHFCVAAMDRENLDRILQIISTKNQEAGQFMDGDAKEVEEDEEVEETNEEEEDDSSDVDSA